jgi:hypothetical protein
MYPEDRVLIAVINRKRDLVHARDDHWYRIPVHQMPHGVSTEYIAFFVSGRLLKHQSSGVHYYARVNGIELRYRYELLPDEVQHPRAGEVYYRLAIGNLLPKTPPIHNPERRSISFIYTTWDRLQAASVISDLYNDADHFVERISKKLRDNGIPS